MKKSLSLFAALFLLSSQGIVLAPSGLAAGGQLQINAPVGCRSNQTFFLSLSQKLPQSADFGILEEISARCSDFPIIFERLVTSSQTTEFIATLTAADSGWTATSKPISLSLSSPLQTINLSPQAQTPITIPNTTTLSSPTEIRFQHLVNNQTLEAYWMNIQSSTPLTIHLPSTGNYRVQVSNSFTTQDFSVLLNPTSPNSFPVVSDPIVSQAGSSGNSQTPTSPSQQTGAGNVSTGNTTTSSGGGSSFLLRNRGEVTDPNASSSFSSSTNTPSSSTSTGTSRSSSPVVTAPSSTFQVSTSGGGGSSIASSSINTPTPESTTSTTPNSQPSTNKCFPDLGARNVEYVCGLVQRGIISGYPDGTFRPSARINRAEYLKIMMLTVFSQSEITTLFDRLKNSSTFKRFPDVPLDAWFAPYVYVATDKGIIKGYPDGTFQPINETNQAEASKISLEAIRSKIRSLDLFLQSYTVPDPWFKPYLDYIYQAFPQVDILNGTSFRSITRAEFAQLAYELLKKSEE